MARRTRTPSGQLTLDDPAHVRALRDAATVPESWARVSPGVKNALTIPTAKFQALGGSLDDLFVAILDSLALLRHPINQHLARTMTAIEHVNFSLEVTLDNRHHENVTLGAAIRRINTTAAKKRGVRLRAKSATGDTKIRDKAATYRRQHPHSRRGHSTRALAVYLARTLNRPVNTVRAALRRLRIT